MNIADYMDESLIMLDDITSNNKRDILEKIAHFMATSEKIDSSNEFLEEIVRREEIETTGVGNGVAFPHARTDSVNKIVIAFARSLQGVNFRAIDGKPVHLFFMIGTPKKDVAQYLKILSKLSRLMKNEDNRKKVLEAKDAAVIIKHIQDMQ